MEELLILPEKAPNLLIAVQPHETVKDNNEEYASDSVVARRVVPSKRSLMKYTYAKHSLKISSRISIQEVTDLLKSEKKISIDNSTNDYKRLRSELLNSHPITNNDDSLIKSQVFQRARNHSAPLFIEKVGVVSKTEQFFEINFQPSYLQKSRLETLLKLEQTYHPNNEFLYHVDPISDDKVDASIRNCAVHNLRFMHNAFFTLNAEIYCKAVNLIDRFIVKVKVKPKYMSCVTAAAYFISAKQGKSTLDLKIPNPDALVQISQCGGSVADLLRMEDIITSKLNGDLIGVDAYDFLRLFASALIVPFDSPKGKGIEYTQANQFSFQGENTANNLEDTDEDDVFLKDDLKGQPLIGPVLRTCSRSLPEYSNNEAKSTCPQNSRMKEVWNGMTGRIVVALCSLEIYRYRPATLALSVLSQFNVKNLDLLAQMCDVPMLDIKQCRDLVERLYDVYYRDPHPSSRRNLVWNLSRRTLSHIGCSSPTPLDTISEDCEVDKEECLQFSFEP